MSSFSTLSACECAQQVNSGQTSARQLLAQAVAQAEKHRQLNAICSLNPQAEQQAQQVDDRLAAGEQLPLAGVPIVIKDNINATGTITSCGSKMLHNYTSPYNATVVERLLAEGAVIVGKANMDEFAMGSSTETSIYGPTHNPHDQQRVAGGSSGGSAVAVAAGISPLSLGSDTGGSVRQPAAFCGVYGFKPTYGRVSRYGLVAYASSLDQVGPFARNAADLALLLDVIAGHDSLDATSLSHKPQFVSQLTQHSWQGLRVGVISQSLAGNTSAVLAALEQTKQAMSAAGASLQELSLPSLEHAVATYYLIAMPEASSNLARYDGIGYGYRAEATELLDSVTRTREQGFGAEVQRRILLGTYALSSGYYEAFYGKALKVRRKIANEFAQAFEQVDVLLTPTSPFSAFELGEKISDPLSMYAADVDTVAANLAGLPALNIPAGFEQIATSKLPIGIQLIGPALADEKLIALAAQLEPLTGLFTQSS